MPTWPTNPAISLSKEHHFVRREEAMKAAMLIPFLAGLASAIPVHRNSSWSWTVLNSLTNEVFRRDLKVIDSAKADSGTVWTLLASDSTTATSDTAVLLQRPLGGHQGWIKSSRLIPWEPEAWSMGYDGVATFAWGQAALPNSHTYAWENRWPLLDGGTMGSIVKSETIQMSRGVWSDSLGVEYFDHGDSEYWMLTRSKQQYLGRKYRFQIPPMGKSMIWSETMSSSDRTSLHNFTGYPLSSDSSMNTIKGILEWQVLENLPDSSYWMGVKIKSIRTIKDSQQVNIEKIRFNPLTGQRIPVRTSIPSPDLFWWRLPQDSIENGKELRHREHNVSAHDAFGSTSREQSQMTASNYPGSIEIDSITYSASSGSGSYNMCGLGCSTSSGYSDGTDYKLLLISLDDKLVRPLDVGVKPVVRHSALGILDLASRYPATTIRWMDARGRSGQIPARQILSQAGGGSRQPLFLDATFPDGTRWKGSFLATHP